MGNELEGRNQTRNFLMQKQKRNRIVIAAAVAVAVTVTALKYKKIGQEKETQQFRELMETRTGWRMMNATDKQRKKDRSNSIENTNTNMNLNYISPQRNTPRKSLSPHPQQHLPQPPLEETLALLRTVSPGDPRGYKEKEPEPKQPKLQQYAELMDVVERFHEIMKPIIEEEKKKPKIMLPGQYKHYPNKDGHLFFYPPKNYRPTPISRPKYLNLSEKQWKQFYMNVLEGVVPFSIIGLIMFAAQQIVQSKTDSECQEQLTNELERIVADGTEDDDFLDEIIPGITMPHLPKHETDIETAQRT
ncbi:MAG: hypothetical protein EZS28_043404 [Streblomastix strix]|uniref:Uncharacterized protein n=1 Tax=Streblomastix strix TaxID=222440 RepID=A0A5J4TT32_9EUKA|nr:MAG: hypothetical protein EZS28_043404 [Streblomastix strix]